MRRNFDEPILDLNGDPVHVGQSAETLLGAINAIWPRLSAELQTEFSAAAEKLSSKPLTLRTVCLSAVLRVYPGEEQMSDDARMERAELARHIYKGGMLDVTVEQCALIKSLLPKRYTDSILIPVIAGELLEKDARNALHDRNQR